MEDVEIQMGLKDIQLEIASVRAENNEVKSMLDEYKITDILGKVHYPEAGDGRERYQQLHIRSCCHNGCVRDVDNICVQYTVMVFDVLFRHKLR